jgi:hypothetical protein
MVGLRYSQIAKRDEGRSGGAAFTQRAWKLPDAKLIKPFPLFSSRVPANKVSYDAVVFDTYDYLDQVVSFSLADTFAAAFQIHFDQTDDDRALRFLELLRYGTNDKTSIWLMRYGFLPDDIPKLVPHVHFVDESRIVFKQSINDADQAVRDLVAWYQ